MTQRSHVSVEPQIFVVLGATGDLMRRKLLPALNRLAAQGRLDENVLILGVARKTELDDDGFRAQARQALSEAGLVQDESAARWCSKSVFFQPTGKGTMDDYRALGARIEALEKAHHLSGNRAFYLALPPMAFPSAIAGLGQAGLNKSRGWTRLVVEKPFGRDLTSAQELNRLLHQYFDESQVYRIDHYLGKETVQNLLVFRFANPLFESAWNRDRVQSVEITVAEELGIEKRAAYYEEAGALRDMIQNHLTQLLTLTAMEVPPAFDAEAIRTEKAKVLRSIHSIDPEQVVFGQYAAGKIDGKPVPGYHDEPGVKPHSQVETFVAMRVEINNWRWQGVPFYLRTGKRLPRRVSQIVVTFRCPPVFIFQPFHTCALHSNVLVITIQPDEGFDLHFEVKSPGQPPDMQTQRLHFRYAEAFAPLPDAYETLLLDVMIGDPTLFVRADWVESSWRIYTPLLEQRRVPHPYAAGTWGPAEASRILAGSGAQWVTG